MIAITNSKKDEAPHSLVLARHLALDIETGNASEDVVKGAIRRWKAPSNLKDPVKIEGRRKEAEAKIREKSALLDGAPIICIAARTDRTAVVFSGLGRRKFKVDGNTVVSAGNERGMLLAFQEWLDKVTGPETILVGFNLRAFDLPKLRARYLAHGLRLPQVLSPRLLDDERQPCIDVMHLFLRYFSAERNRDLMVGLGEVVERLGLPQFKNQINGSMVPKLAKAGKLKNVFTYCAVDTLATLTAFSMMTSAPEME